MSSKIGSGLYVFLYAQIVNEMIGLKDKAKRASPIERKLLIRQLCQVFATDQQLPLVNVLDTTDQI